MGFLSRYDEYYENLKIRKFSGGTSDFQKHSYLMVQVLMIKEIY